MTFHASVHASDRVDLDNEACRLSSRFKRDKEHQTILESLAVSSIVSSDKESLSSIVVCMVEVDRSRCRSWEERMDLLMPRA